MANAKFGAPISILGAQGTQGDRGLPGFSTLAGNGPPSPETGQAGDVYIDLDAGALYAPKTVSGWPSATRSLIGNTGPMGVVGVAGASLLQGYGQPADTLGQDGDSYFNSQNGAIYGPRAGGHWPAAFTSLVGPAGGQGETGTLILAANGAPSDAQGSDGDFFVDTLDGRLYGPKQNGAWGNGLSLIGPQGSTGDRGATGAAGSDGATILRGDGPPANQGKLGDFYFDSTDSVFYGPRGADGASPWPATGFSVLGAVGPAGPQGPGGMMGADGKTLRSGAGDPDNSLGEDGDFYFNASNGFLVGPKINGAWPLPGFLLKGPAGDVGAAGPAGPVGPQGPGILTGAGAPSSSNGVAGALYIDSQNYVLYGPRDDGAQNPWSRFVNIVGPQGPTGADSTVPGPQGPTGARGFSVQSGTGAPPNTLGQDGDLYVDLAGPNLYAAKASGAWPKTYQSLAGATGPQGPTSTTPGPQGSQGYSLLTGAGAPSSTYGNDGDSYIDLNAGNLYGAKSNGAWPTKFSSLIGATGQTGATGAAGAAGSNGTILRYGSGAPTSSIVANDGDFYIDQVASRLYGPRANGSFPAAYVSLVGPTGANGSLIDTGSGPPSANTGSVGDIYLDLAAGNLYGNKTQSGWPATYKSLVGPQGAAAVLPNDVTANSLVVAPVSGDTSVVKIQINNANGQVFLADASGNTTVAALTAAGPSSLGAASASSLTTTGALSVGASASIAGAISATRFVATSAGSSTAPFVGFSKDFLNSGNVTSTGFYSEGNFGQLYEVVESFVARSLTYVGTNPRDNGAGFLTHNAITNVSGAGNVAHRWYVATSTLAMAINGSGGVSMNAGLAIGGGMTVAGGIVLSSGALTFPDGTSLTTATVSNQATYKATSAGTAAAPAFAYTGASNGAGVYFDANGNTLFSVNGFKSLYSNAASGAAAGANGWAIASTLAAGQAALTVGGSSGSATIDGAGAFSATSVTSPTATFSGAVSTGALTASGLVSAPNVTLGSSGKLTFGDGTTMTTAATSSSSSGSQGVAGSQLRYGTGAPTSSNPATQNDGDSYIDTQQSMLYGPRASGSWPAQPVSLIGPTGPLGPIGATGAAGPTYLTGFSCGVGPYGLTPASTTFSSTPYVIPLPGTTTASTFTPLGPSALLGVYAYASVAVTLTLYDVTASATVYSVAITAGQSIGGNYFSTTAYPMTALHTYQWQVTGSSSGIVQIEPFYMMPANTPGVTVQTCSAAGYSTSTTFNTTAATLPVYGGTTAQGVWAHTPPRTGGVYSAQATYTPASGTASTASVTPVLWYGSLSSGSGAAVSITFNAVTATGLPQTILAPRLTDLTSLSTGNYFYWKVTGSGSGTLSVTLLPLV